MHDPDTQAWLDAFLARHDAVAGTVHVERDDDLWLVADRNIPPPVLAKVEHVARGKGMAGLAQVRREPVQTCNLQTDDTGTLNPAARLVQAQAAIALPVLAADGSLKAVVGAAFEGERVLPDSLVRQMMSEAQDVPDAG